ncbi:proline-rich protein HaeIII subfamily 1-like [Tiliqua scincoides]|uniref:proline-rich protein HaeIII subfamily 1-like n=1 Tax=Tiliqua scincoides TaxID=71010 RepID=UPI0034628F11
MFRLVSKPALPPPPAPQARAAPIPSLVACPGDKPSDDPPPASQSQALPRPRSPARGGLFSATLGGTAQVLRCQRSRSRGAPAKLLDLGQQDRTPGAGRLPPPRKVPTAPFTGSRRAPSHRPPTSLAAHPDLALPPPSRPQPMSRPARTRAPNGLPFPPPSASGHNCGERVPPLSAAARPSVSAAGPCGGGLRPREGADGARRRGRPRGRRPSIVTPAPRREKGRQGRAGRREAAAREEPPPPPPPPEREATARPPPAGPAERASEQASGEREERERARCPRPSRLHLGWQPRSPLPPPAPSLLPRPGRRPRGSCGAAGEGFGRTGAKPGRTRERRCWGRTSVEPQS